MPEPITAAEAQALLDAANPSEWTVEFVQPPEGRPGDPAALLRALFTPAARVLDQGGRGIVAEVTVEADAALIAAAPDLAAALIAVTEERKAIPAELTDALASLADAGHSGVSLVVGIERLRAERDRLARAASALLALYDSEPGASDGDEADAAWAALREAIEADDEAAEGVKP